MKFIFRIAVVGALRRAWRYRSGPWLVVALLTVMMRLMTHVRPRRKA